MKKLLVSIVVIMAVIAGAGGELYCMYRLVTSNSTVGLLWFPVAIAVVFAFGFGAAAFIEKFWSNSREKPRA